jgi:hypothetical protein
MNQPQEKMRLSGPVKMILSTAALVPLLLIVGGGYVAVFGHRFGAYLAIAGLMLNIVRNLVIGVISYRHVMARPWPKVAPLLDADEDW